MSDGPYKSPGQPRRWKQVLKIACNHAYPLTDGEEKARSATIRDFADAPVKAVLAILLNSLKDRLLPDQISVLTQLKKLQRGASRSTIKKELIDCARGAVYEDLAHEADAYGVIQLAVQLWLNRERRSLDELVRLCAKPCEEQESRRRLASMFDALDVQAITTAVISGAKPALELRIAEANTDLDQPGPRIMPEAA